MLKKTITYEDFDGNERTEDFYFNISQAELVEMMADAQGDYGDLLTKMVQAQNQGELIKVVKKIILKAYGQRTSDGKGFIKNEEVRESFATSEAYSNLFMELVTDDAAAAKFMVGIVPKALVPRVEQHFAAANRDLDKDGPPYTPTIEDVQLPTEEPVLEPQIATPIPDLSNTQPASEKPLTEMSNEELEAWRKWKETNQI
jgi:hypothetical protein